MIDDGGTFGQAIHTMRTVRDPRRAWWRVGTVQISINRSAPGPGELIISPSAGHNLEGVSVSRWSGFSLGPCGWQVRNLKIDEREAALLALARPDGVDVVFRTPFRSRLIRQKIEDPTFQADGTSFVGTGRLRMDEHGAVWIDGDGSTHHLRIVPGWGD